MCSSDLVGTEAAQHGQAAGERLHEGIAGAIAGRSRRIGGRRRIGDGDGGRDGDGDGDGAIVGHGVIVLRMRSHP